MFGLQLIVVFVVFIANIERRIGESEIDGAIGNFLKALDAIPVVNFIPISRHNSYLCSTIKIRRDAIPVLIVAETALLRNTPT
jgi:hypothetical protein